MQTVQFFKNFIFKLNINGENPDDTESFYDFCLSSIHEDKFLTKEEFLEIFASSPNNGNTKISNDQIQKYFFRYEQFMGLLLYTKKRMIFDTEIR